MQNREEERVIARRSIFRRAQRRLPDTSETLRQCCCVGRIRHKREKPAATFEWEWIAD